MEGAKYFNNYEDIEKEHKMEIENNLNLNRSNMVNKFIFSRRTMNSFPTNNDTYNTGDKKFSVPSKINEKSNFDVIKIMNEVMENYKKLYQKDFLTIYHLKKGEEENMKNELLKNIKKIRIFLSKENISVSTVKNILNNNIQNFFDLLIDSLNSNDYYLHLESIWIMNNLIFFMDKYNEIVIDINKVSNSIINYLILIQKKNENVKSLLIEKIYRILGNLIHINNNIIEIIINNNIIKNVIENLNSPHTSFRTACLWLLNKILIILKKNNANDNCYINYFIYKGAISNYNFIFSRIKNNIILDEISEFYWFISELSKYDSKILIPIFILEVSHYKNYQNINMEYALKNFSFILDNSLTNKMFQISFRLISNLLVVCNNEVKNENLLIKFIELFFEKKSVLLFINDVLNSPKNKYDFSLVKDIVLLIFNLICLSPIKTSIFFKKGIVNLISDRDYHVNIDIMKVLFLAFYRILISNSYCFEPNDEKVIKTCLVILKRFKEDETVLILFIDILYNYLKASHINFENDLENEIQFIKNENNISIETYQNIYLKLSSIVKLYSPLSKFMRKV